MNASLDSKRVIVLEKNPKKAQEVVEVLKQEGLISIQYHNFEEALVAVRRGGFKMIVCEFLPEEKGYVEFAATLKQELGIGPDFFVSTDEFLGNRSQKREAREYFGSPEIQKKINEVLAPGVTLSDADNVYNEFTQQLTLEATHLHMGEELNILDFLEDQILIGPLKQSSLPQGEKEINVISSIGGKENRLKLFGFFSVESTLQDSGEWILKFQLSDKSIELWKQELIRIKESQERIHTFMDKVTGQLC